jgi:hypothetical protein
MCTLYLCKSNEFHAGVCADHFVDRLRAAGLLVVRSVQWGLHL